MKRSPITRKKTKRLSEYDREFEAMKPLVKERSRGRCESKNLLDRAYRLNNVSAFNNLAVIDELVVNCTGRGEHVHHRKYRGNSRGGTNALDNLLHTCLNCHSWIHAHGGFGEPANLLGLALSAGESEDL